MPNVIKVERVAPRNDHGADLLVTYRAGLPFEPLQREELCLVQVKSYEGELADRRAVDDLSRAFTHYPQANMGLIVSTAEKTSPEFEQALDELQDKLDRRATIVCLYWTSFASFVVGSLD